MYLKNKVMCLFYLLLLISLIGIACSKKVEQTAETDIQATKDEATNNEAINNEATKQEDTTTESKEITEAPDSEEDNSPWKLVSETSVETKVNYAGFLNEMIGVTVGYAGETSYTSDGGEKWSKSSNVSACRYGLELYDESFIISSGNSGVNLVSKDQGRSWSYLGEFPLKSSSAFNRFLSILDTDNIYIGSMKSLGTSNDGGKTWQEIELPENCTKLTGMYFLTPETGYLLGGDGTLFKTVDSCKTWTTQTIDLSGQSFANIKMPAATMNFQDEDHGIIVYLTNTSQLCCIKTEDGGSTWESIEMPKASGAPYLSRDGKYLTLSSATKKISLFRLEDE